MGKIRCSNWFISWIHHVPRSQTYCPQISQRIQCVCAVTGASQIRSCGCNRYHNISRGAKLSRPPSVSCFSPEGQNASCPQVHHRILLEEMMQRCYRMLLTDNLHKLTYKLIKLTNSEPLLCFISDKMYLITLFSDLKSRTNKTGVHSSSHSSQSDFS